MRRAQAGHRPQHQRVIDTEKVDKATDPATSVFSQAVDVRSFAAPWAGPLKAAVVGLRLNR